MFNFLFINITIFYIQHITHEKSDPSGIFLIAMLHIAIRLRLGKYLLLILIHALCLSRDKEDNVSKLLFDYHFMHLYIN